MADLEGWADCALELNNDSHDTVTATTAIEEAAQHMTSIPRLLAEAATTTPAISFEAAVATPGTDAIASASVNPNTKTRYLEQDQEDAQPPPPTTSTSARADPPRSMMDELSKNVARAAGKFSASGMTLALVGVCTLTVVSLVVGGLRVRTRAAHNEQVLLTSKQYNDHLLRRIATLESSIEAHNSLVALRHHQHQQHVANSEAACHAHYQLDHHQRLANAEANRFSYYQQASRFIHLAKEAVAHQQQRISNSHAAAAAAQVAHHYHHLLYAEATHFNRPHYGRARTPHRRSHQHTRAHRHVHAHNQYEHRPPPMMRAVVDELITSIIVPATTPAGRHRHQIHSHDDERVVVASGQLPTHHHIHDALEQLRQKPPMPRATTTNQDGGNLPTAPAGALRPSPLSPQEADSEVGGGRHNVAGMEERMSKRRAKIEQRKRGIHQSAEPTNPTQLAEDPPQAAATVPDSPPPGSAKCPNPTSEGKPTTDAPTAATAKDERAAVPPRTRDVGPRVRKYRSMTIKQLREILERHGAECRTCVEKDDLVGRVLAVLSNKNSKHD